MAFLKDEVTHHGVTASYHRIDSVSSFDPKGGLLNCTVSTWIDQAARDNGMTFLNRRNYTLMLSDLPELSGSLIGVPASGSLISEMYVAIKNQSGSFFADASDV